MDVPTLLSLSSQQLDALFSELEPGPIPNGQMDGTVLLHGRHIDEMISNAVKAFAWQGKTFNRKKGIITNRIDGHNVIAAQLYIGPSLFDLEDCIVLDYSMDQRLWHGVDQYRRHPVALRDEIRLIEPDLYLGKAYTGKKPILHFALRSSSISSTKLSSSL